MRDIPRTMVEAEGARLLERDIRLACRPHAHAGESNVAFATRMALHYGIPVEEAQEILGH